MLRRTAALLRVNASTGHRWSPIPKPPPPHTDRLYGTHSVLNALRVIASCADDDTVGSDTRRVAATSQLSPSEGSMPVEKTEEEKGLRNHASALLAARISGSDLRPSQEASPQGRSEAVLLPSADRTGRPARHPHRRFVNCLYVRDFSVEGASDSGGAAKKRKKVIPAQYSALHRITALAKEAQVPVRYVPRKELWQLCGERRNQNVVLEVASYEPRPMADVSPLLQDDAAAANHRRGQRRTGEENREDRDEEEVAASSRQTIVLYLDKIIDPTNIGSILRTCFFFGVDHVVLSPDCAGCTPAVARTSTGFLEHLCVWQSTVPTAAFLSHSRRALAACARDEQNAPTPRLHTLSTERGEGGDAKAERVGSARLTWEIIGSTAHRPAGPRPPSPSPSPVSASAAAAQSEKTHCFRLLVLGNEDAGLPESVIQQCTHLLHIRSPRQQRLDALRMEQLCSVPGDVCAPPGGTASGVASIAGAEEKAVAAPELSVTQRRELAVRKLRRLQRTEVSLNVNTACATLLSHLVAEGEGSGASSLVQRVVNAPLAQAAGEA